MNWHDSAPLAAAIAMAGTALSVVGVLLGANAHRRAVREYQEEKDRASSEIKSLRVLVQAKENLVETLEESRRDAQAETDRYKQLYDAARMCAMRIAECAMREQKLFLAREDAVNTPQNREDADVGD